ncbi:MAG: amino acid adenylation domain-containing protein, partial [bacterium]|nr:amino acid adenylation domain-containing protein [bacterium]
MVKDNTLQFRLNLALKGKKFKDNIAVECGNKGIAYAELDKRSDLVAHWIINKGIEEETFIGIFIDDRIEFIIAVLGVLKARCVFVPLDPAHPKDRLEIMIDSTDIKLVIGDNGNWKRLFPDNNNETVPFLSDVEFISIADCLANDNSSRPVDGFDIRYGPEDKIYVYFTSGSTGRPKAFVGKNKSLLHFIRWEIDTFGIDETFRVSQFTTPGFDAFLRDVFVPLCSGGTVCIPGTADVLLSSPRLIDWMDRSKINLIHCVPAFFRLFSSKESMVSENNFKSLKFILLSGEKINPPDLSNWYDAFAERIKLVNLWGTSETTLAKTFYFIDITDTNRKRIPVGKPIRGARVVILNENLGICKDRTVGDLYI